MASLSALKIKLALAFVFLLALVSVLSLRPVDPRATESKLFEIRSGDGFWQIVSNLRSAGLIRSSVATTELAILRGQVRSIKPGRYELSPAFSTMQILNLLEGGSKREVEVTIPEGASIYEVDYLLSQAGVLPAGDLLASSTELEGYLYPDTYRFFTGASTTEVLDKITSNFENKVGSLLPPASRDRHDRLILASLIEKEVPNLEDGRIVAGILEKRLKARMPLQVDATLCYAKLQKAAEAHLTFSPCSQVSGSDKDIRSPYNTYKNTGLPPGPIGNPSLWAIQAALSPKSSPYWFYISDPETRKTIFAKTLDEQTRNINRYLR